MSESGTAPHFWHYSIYFAKWIKERKEGRREGREGGRENTLGNVKYPFWNLCHSLPSTCPQVVVVKDRIPFSVSNWASPLLAASLAPKWGGNQGGFENIWEPGVWVLTHFWTTCKRHTQPHSVYLELSSSAISPFRPQPTDSKQAQCGRAGAHSPVTTVAAAPTKAWQLVGAQ